MCPQLTPKVEKQSLSQVSVRSNIANNHSAGLWEVISGYYCSQCTCKVDETPKVEKQSVCQVRVSSNMLIITHLDYEKSYLVIIVPNAHVSLTKRDIRLSWSSFKHCLKPFVYPLGHSLVYHSSTLCTSYLIIMVICQVDKELNQVMR